MTSNWPVIISIVVGAIGLVGLVAAVIAAMAIRTERKVLKRGRDSLADLPVGADYNYREWINERHLDDSHFADHLRGAADAAKAGRAVSLSELHQVSARREASRRSARLSSGVTGLLLVCGIAGTLWCIKPVLGQFDVTASPGGEMGATNGAVATKMIRDLSNAFWPSLIALIGTVVVVSARGFYTHGRGVLSGKLDRLDLEDLFGRFPPPSISRELDEVRAQLGNLVGHIVSSQRNFDGAVERLTNAAQGISKQTLPLYDASERFSKAANQLAPKFDELVLTLSSHLGQSAPILKQLGALQLVSQQITVATTQMEHSGKTLSNHLVLSHQVLKQVSKDLPAQMQSACETASRIIADATSAAIATACTEAVRSLDAAAAPVRQAASEINQGNQALRTEIAKIVEAGVQDLRRHGDATNIDLKANGRLMVDEMTNSLSGVVDDMRQRTDAMEQAVTRNLHGTVESVTKLQSSATDAISGAASAIGRLDDLHRQTQQMLDECGQGRRDIGELQQEIADTTTQVEEIGQRIESATSAAIRSLDAAAGPVQQAAIEINQGNQALRTGMAKIVEAGVQDLRRQGEATNNDLKANGRLMVDQVAKSLGEVADDMRQRTNAMDQAFARNLQATVETVTKLQGSATEAVNRAASTIDRLDGLQRQTKQMLDESGQGRRDIGKIQQEIAGTTTQVVTIGQRIQGATGELGNAIDRATLLGSQLTRITSELDRLTAQSGETHTGIKELNDQQQALVGQLQGLAQRGEQARDGWQMLYDATGPLLTTGGALNADLTRLLADGGLLAKNLDGAVELVMRQQSELTAQLENLQEQLRHLDKIESGGLRGLIFGRKA